MNILVTGGAGFIGSNFVRHMLNTHSDASIVNLDALTYAGVNIHPHELDSSLRYAFVKGNIANESDVQHAMEATNLHGKIDVIVNFAAESHVDRSIEDPGAFVHTNVRGTQVLLDATRHYAVKKYVQISTDEVYGTLGPDEPAFTEETPLRPNSPYSASKAGADLLVRAYHETYDLPVNITRCSNNYGPYHFPEKLIPLMILNAMEDKPLPVYGDGMQIRDWLHVRDHCAAIDLVIQRGRPGEVYNIGGQNERTNVHVIRAILQLLGKPETLIRFVKDRPGHDRRYAINATKIRTELGWEPRYTFEEGLAETIDWYLSNQEWWGAIRDGSYQAALQREYDGNGSGARS